MDRRHTGIPYLFVLDAAAGAAITAAGPLATRRRAPGHAPARPPAGPLPGAARAVPGVSGAALAGGPGGQHPPGTSRVLAAATAAGSPPPHPKEIGMTRPERSRR